MVRVIPVHNFTGQNIASIEEPTAACIASTSTPGRELLLLALSTHCVEVHELTPELKLLTDFPTVDLATQILHCSKGDYVVTLESKVSRDGSNVSNFVRVYVNWSMLERQGHAMRARIAGRVTPSLNRPLNSLEMIELPLTAQPTTIACCQTTGNLLVATGNTALLHEFKIETQQASRLKFIDFEARPWSLGFSFSPTRMEIAEDFISILDPMHFLVFRLTNPMYEDIDQLSSLASTNSSSADKTSASTNSSLLDKQEKSPNNAESEYPCLKTLNALTIDLNSDQSISISTDNSNSKTSCRPAVEQGSGVAGIESTESHCNTVKNSTYPIINPNRSYQLQSTKNKLRSKTNARQSIDWERLVREERDETQRLISQGSVDPGSQPLTVNLPSISLERASPGHSLSPFVLNPSGMDVVIKTTSPDDGWSENYAVKNLLRVKILKTTEKSNDTDHSESFTCSELKPLYLKKECNTACLKKSIFRSDKFKYLHGVTCLVCTNQEGYVYHFSAVNCDEANPTCLTTYPFTAPVRHVALENTVLHALTEAGLESYTMRLPHHVARNLHYIDSSKITCPAVSEPVCLIGLKPFLGMQNLLCAGNRLVLLAKAERSWTLYSLTLPSPETLYSDILNMARNHRSSSPNTYKHLLGEGHAILRLSKDVRQYPFDDTGASTLQKNVANTSKLESLYTQSCALLADYYINSDLETEWSLSIPYYRMSGLKAADVLSRKSVANARGFMKFLTETLANMRSGQQADALFQSHNVVDMLGAENVENLSKLILRSSVLREYPTEKLMQVLSRHKPSDCVRLASVLLHLQAERQDWAEKALEPISDSFLRRTVLEHWHLLFDATAIKKRSRAVPTFSEFSGTLMRRKKRSFCQILSQLTEDGILYLYQVMQVFFEYLPSRVGRDGHDAAAALQLFIEIYFQNHFDNKYRDVFLDGNNDVCYDFPTVEAFRILVRSYLGNLSQSKVYKTEQNVKDCKENDEEAYLFANFRPPYLNKMPPFVMDYQKILTTLDIKDLADLKESEGVKSVRGEVPKLQALLASGYLPDECVHEVKQFLESQEIDGITSFKTLCCNDTRIITRMLMEDCPQAVLQYAKDKYTKESEWKYLIESLQIKIYSLTELKEGQESQHCFFDQIMKETLTHLAQTLPLDELCRVLPQKNEAVYRRYIDACRKAGQADHIKSLIVATGHQLLATLNL